MIYIFVFGVVLYITFSILMWQQRIAERFADKRKMIIQIEHEKQKIEMANVQEKVNTLESLHRLRLKKLHDELNLLKTIRQKIHEVSKKSMFFSHYEEAVNKEITEYIDFDSFQLKISKIDLSQYLINELYIYSTNVYKHPLTSEYIYQHVLTFSHIRIDYNYFYFDCEEEYEKYKNYLLDLWETYIKKQMIPIQNQIDELIQKFIFEPEEKPIQNPKLITWDHSRTIPTFLPPPIGKGEMITRMGKVLDECKALNEKYHEDHRTSCNLELLRTSLLEIMNTTQKEYLGVDIPDIVMTKINSILDKMKEYLTQIDNEKKTEKNNLVIDKIDIEQSILSQNLNIKTT